MEENKIKVYVKINQQNVIVDINSYIFLQDVKDYICIDEGIGDKYSHAQGNYLDKSLSDMQGKYNYKLVDNKVVELSDDEKEKLFQKEVEPSEKINSDILDLTEVVVSQQKLIEELSKEIKNIKSCVNNDV